MCAKKILKTDPVARTHRRNAGQFIVFYRTFKHYAMCSLSYNKFIALMTFKTIFLNSHSHRMLQYRELECCTQTVLNDVQLSIQLILCFDFVDILHLLDDPILIFRLYHKLVIRLMIQLIDSQLLSYAFCTVGCIKRGNIF